MSESTTTTNPVQNQNTANPGPSVKVEVLLGHRQQQKMMATGATKPLPVDPLAMDEDDELPIVSSELVPCSSSAVVIANHHNNNVISVGGPTPPATRAVVVHQQQPPPQQKFQDVRVDNWGNYCLQRLQVMYDRGDFCDLTMLFSTHDTLKVHRVVVNLCTEYFANLERLFGLTDGVLVLPKDVEYQAMVTIIKFFYTGKLEIRGNQFNEVYRTVKLMNITILIKLLEAHAKKPIAQAKKEASKPIVFKQAVEIGRPMQKGQTITHHQTSGMQMSFTGTTAVANPGGGGSTKQTLQVTTPGAKLPPGVKTKTVLARVQPQTSRMGQHSPNKSLSHKKLPIWKERKFTPVNTADPLRQDEMKKWAFKEEPARPTRFEWGDPEDDPGFMSTVVSHTLMDKQKDKQNSIRKAEDIFDAVKNQNLGKRNLMTQEHIMAAKAKMNASVETPPTKIPRLGSQAVDKGLEALGSHQNESDHVNLTDEVVEEEVSTTEVEPHPAQRKITSALKPALKSHPQGGIRMTPMVGKNDPNLGDMNAQQVASTSGSGKCSSGSGKTVRFASEVEKENNTKEIPIICTNAEDFASSHSKIIAEVLKKYPDLVKDKQNIKLKIVQKGTDNSSSKDKSKVSYIVLKSTSSPDSMGSVHLKKPSQTSANRAFWDQDNKGEKKPSGAENTSGPWLCAPCGGGDEAPMVFESYYSYRRHLVDVHGERIDARICEHCGQKASKRNLLLYHLYTKHGVPPPKNTNFPHCDRCDYVALSESLLNKHKQGHDATKEYACQICNACFKSNGALQGHMTANLHRNLETKVYECPYCRKPFVRNINLKGHIRALHKDIARIEEMDDPRLPPDDTLIERGMNSPNRKRTFPSILAGPVARPPSMEILPHNSLEQGHQVLVTADGHTIEILHGLDPHSMSMPINLVPSSEAEAMTNVASSIAASLGLESQGVHGTTEYMTGVTSDGSQAVYIMDSSQPAVEVDMSAMGLSSDGTIIYDGEDPSSQGQFIVQDIHGNQFRKMTGIDETGQAVTFFQLSEENGQITMAPAMMEDGMQITQDASSVFVSSGMNMPITVSSDGSGQQGQVILASGGHGSIVYEMEPSQDPHQQVAMSEAVEEHHRQQQQQYEHHEGQTVQELHIVLDPNENNESVEHEQIVQEEETTIITAEQNDDEEHNISETYVHNGECEETGEHEITQHIELHHHEEEALEVQQESSHSDNGMTLDQSEESSNIMVVEEVNADADEEGTQSLGVVLETHMEEEETTDSVELHIQQDEEEGDTQELQIDNASQETEQLELEDNNGETVELEIDDNNADTQELEEVEESETQDMVGHHGEGIHEQLDTQVVGQEMELVEEVTGEPLSMVEEVVNNDG